MGVSTSPSATSNILSSSQPRSNLVKHPLKNTENDCHQWLSDSFRVLRIRFRPGLLRSSSPPSWFKGDLLLRRGEDKERLQEEGKGIGKEGEGRNGRRKGEWTASPNSKFTDPALQLLVYTTPHPSIPVYVPGSSICRIPSGCHAHDRWRSSRVYCRRPVAVRLEDARRRPYVRPVSFGPLHAAFGHI